VLPDAKISFWPFFAQKMPKSVEKEKKIPIPKSGLGDFFYVHLQKPLRTTKCSSMIFPAHPNFKNHWQPQLFKCPLRISIMLRDL
jgi:hypothetical protein